APARAGSGARAALARRRRDAAPLGLRARQRSRFRTFLPGARRAAVRRRAGHQRGADAGRAYGRGATRAAGTPRGVRPDIPDIGEDAMRIRGSIVLLPLVG